MSLSRAVRFALAAIVVGVSYANIWIAILIKNADMLFRDMLNNQPLPKATQFVIDYRDHLLGLSICLPIAAIVIIFLRQIAFPVYVSGILVLATLLQFFFTMTVLLLPLISIVTNMSGVTQ